MKVLPAKLVTAVDCGAVVNRGLAEQQVGSAMMWALAQAGAASGFRATPEIVIRFIGTEGPPSGLSGLGAIPVASAIANAIHSASGRRMRSLSFDPMAA